MSFKFAIIPVAQAHDFKLPTLDLKMVFGAPGWHSTLDLCSGLDLEVASLSPTLGSLLGMETT